MSYSISLSGHGPEPDDLREIFETTVRALRAVTPEGQTVGGSLSGSGPDGVSFPSVSAGDVLDLEAADVDDDADGDGDPDDATGGEPATDEPIEETGAEPAP